MQRGRGRIIVVVVLVFGVLVAPALAGAWNPPSQSPFGHDFDGPGVPRGLDRSDLPFVTASSRRQADKLAGDAADRRKAREERRKTADARRERRESRTKYRNTSRDGVKALLRDRFAQQLDAFDFVPSRLRAAGRVRAYLDDRTARVDDGHGGQQLMVSAAPLQTTDANGEKQPVDLSLNTTGDSAKPANPLVDVAFGNRLGDGFSLPGAGLKLTVGGAHPDATASALDDSTLVYSDADTDLDVTVKPTIGGLETAAQIRSADAPEDIPLHFTLPDGVSAQKDSAGNVVFARGSDPVAKLYAPNVVDADGVDVPAAYTVDGATVVMHVSHRDRDVAYPLLADPVLEDWATDGNGNYNNSWYYGRNLQGLNDWFFYEDRNGYYPHSNGYCLGGMDCYHDGYGLHIYGYGAAIYPAGSYGEWLYSPPGQTTFIPRVEYGWTYHDQRGTAGTRLAAAIFNTKTNLFTGYHGFDTPQSGIYDTVRTGDGISGAPNGNLAVFAMQMLDERYRQNGPSVYAGGAVIFLDDPEAPTDGAIAAPGDWVRGTVPVTTSASDPGLGVKYFNLYAPDKNGVNQAQTYTDPCVGTRSKACPASTSHAYQLDTTKMPDGTQTLGAQGYDPVYHASAGAYATLKVDNTGPSIDLSGELYDARDRTDASGMTLGGVFNPSTGLSVRTTDNRAGVATISMRVDGNQLRPEDRVSPACANGSCPSTSDGRFILDMDDVDQGAMHTITVTATDRLGNTSSQSFPIFVGDLPQELVDGDDGSVPAGGLDSTEPVSQDCQADDAFDADSSCQADTQSSAYRTVAAEPSLRSTQRTALVRGSGVNNTAPLATLPGKCDLLENAPVTNVPTADQALRWGLSDQKAYFPADASQSNDIFTEQAARDLNVPHVRVVIPYDLITHAQRVPEGDPACTTYHNIYFFIKNNLTDYNHDVLIAFEKSRTAHTDPTSHRDDTNKSEWIPDVRPGVDSNPDNNGNPGYGGTNGKLPTYDESILAVMNEFPTVHLYEAWNEPNLGRQPTHGASQARKAGQLWRQLNQRCRTRGCVPVAGDFTDQCIGGSSGCAFSKDYLAAYTKGLGGAAPPIWGLHPYTAMVTHNYDRMLAFFNRPEVKAAGLGVWITEVGAYASRSRSPYKRRNDTATQASDLNYFLRFFVDDQAYDPLKITRFYYYDWFSRPNSADDTSLTAPHEIGQLNNDPSLLRPVYNVYKQRTSP